MENKLKKLFDFQRYQKDERLEKMIDEANEDDVYGVLDDSFLYQISAAGEIDTRKPEDKDDI